jgi:hypothetical protein
MTGSGPYVNYFNALVKAGTASNGYTRPSHLVYCVMKLAEAEWHISRDAPGGEAGKKQLLTRILERCYEHPELVRLLAGGRPDIEWAMFYRKSFYDDRVLLAYCAETGLFSRETIETVMKHFLEQYQRERGEGRPWHDGAFEREMAQGLSALKEMREKRRAYERRAAVCG